MDTRSHVLLQWTVYYYRQPSSSGPGPCLLCPGLPKWRLKAWLSVGFHAKVIHYGLWLFGKKGTCLCNMPCLPSTKQRQLTLCANKNYAQLHALFCSQQLGMQFGMDSGLCSELVRWSTKQNNHSLLRSKRKLCHLDPPKHSIHLTTFFHPDPPKHFFA